MTVYFLILFSCFAQAEILIGVAGPMTGTYSSFGSQMVAGVKAAVDDLNAKGGIESQLLDVVTVDDGCDNRQAETVAKELIAKNVRVVIGHFCSYPSLAAAKLYEAADIPMLAPSPSLPALTEAGLSNVLRLASRDDAQGAFAAKRMREDFPDGEIGSVSDSSAGAMDLLSTFNSGAKDQSLVFKPNATSFDDILNMVKSRNIKALFCACTASDAGELAAALAGTTNIYGPDALLVPQFWEKSGAAGEGTMVSFARDPQSHAEAKALLGRLPNADGPTLPGYAAVQLFAQAAEVIGSQNGKGMISYLRSGKPFPTVVGTLSFDAKGDLRQQNFVWYKWSNGAYAAEP